jgi:hypothetical protein
MKSRPSKGTFGVKVDFEDCVARKVDYIGSIKGESEYAGRVLPRT